MRQRGILAASVGAALVAGIAWFTRSAPEATQADAAVAVERERGDGEALTAPAAVDHTAPRALDAAERVAAVPRDDTSAETEPAFTHVLRGRVVDEDRMPVAGARVNSRWSATRTRCPVPCAWRAASS